jgi:hypothetical protein
MFNITGSVGQSNQRQSAYAPISRGGPGSWNDLLRKAASRWYEDPEAISQEKEGNDMNYAYNISFS